VLGRDARKKPLHPRPEERGLWVRAGKEGMVPSDGLNAWVFIDESLCAAG
jgi:hypothetical protein